VTAPRLEAADRVNMLMVFVPYLIEHSPVSVGELAATFNIDPSQVRELVSLLAVSGVPGDSGSYQHQDLFDINWDVFEESDVVELWNHVGPKATPRFSAREAATLVAGLNYLRSIVQPDLQPQLENLLAKISQGSSAVPESISVDSVKNPPSLEMLTAAIAGQTTVTFDYQTTSGARSSRTVSPLRVDVVGFAWYLRGWCHDREALRTFRLDRLTQLTPGTVAFRSPVSASYLSDELFTPGSDDIVAEVRTQQSFLSALSEYAPEMSSVSHDGCVIVLVRFAELANVITFVARYAGHVEILAPEAVRASVATWASEQLV
jgi:proteasome accessory factor C